MGSNFAKANFILNGERLEAFYNFDGTTIGTSKAIVLDKLSKTALAIITKKYSFLPYSLKKCIEFINADNEKHFIYH